MAVKTLGDIVRDVELYVWVNSTDTVWRGETVLRELLGLGRVRVTETVINGVCVTKIVAVGDNLVKL